MIFIQHVDGGIKMYDGRAGVPEAYKSCSHFFKILLTSADLKSTL